MNHLMTMLRKELRSYFLSPVALIFLGVFLVVTLFVFFTQGRFFARNIADIRPLFEWLPILLIFLVSALTMRAWSEEQKMGTLEILMTLPVKTGSLVLGKLAAGMVLVALALALTLPLPITVSFLGDLDWGPVIGGYLGALLLAGAYMSIGLCVSSKTDNQIVALMVTMVIGGLLYLVGHDSVVAFFGNETGSVLRAVGSGSRFESIERGVIDLRDVFYYASIIIFFVALNVQFIEAKRTDTVAASGRRRTRSRWLTIGFAALNVVVGNMWLAPITSARADLTEEGQYSISDVTEKILGELNEPLRISGYFSEKTHPLLAPLVPRIRDILAEYQIRGGKRVTVSFANPNKDEELEEEIAELYDIKPVPFRVSERHEESVVNSYFHVLVRYGDQYEVLSFGDLIEVFADDNNVDVRLRNLEYDMTKTIKRLAAGFRTMDAMFAELEKPAELKLYVTRGALPEELGDVPDKVRKAASEIAEKAKEKFRFEEVDLTDDEAKQKQLYEEYGLRPMAVDLLGDKRFYLYAVLQVGEQLERIPLQGELTEASVKESIEAGVKRGTPGFLKTIGLLTEDPKPVPQNPQLPPQFQQPQPQPDYRLLESTLSEEFTVKRVKADEGYIPADVDVLVVAKPGALGDNQKFAIDQYLMQGGSVIALTGAYDVTIDRAGLDAQKSDSGLLEMLEHYGVAVKDEFVLDKRNARFPVPIEEQRGAFVLKRIKLMDYPFFADIRQESFNEGHAALSGLQNVVLNWGSPIDVAEDIKDVVAEILFETSEEAWTSDSTRILPESLEGADSAFEPEGGVKSYPVAASLVGRFTSYFSDKPSPLFGGDASQEPQQEGADRTGRTIKESPPDSRLVVVGSSAFASDLVARLSDQIGGGVYRGNFQLVRNLIDWALADTDLLQIRTTGAFARTLKPLEDGERNAWEFGNYAVVLLALIILIAVASTRRRRAKPLVVETKEGQA